MQVKKLETMTSRTGRHMQRYYEGSRQVVGCIPFRFKKTKESPLVHGTLTDDLDVLLISSQKSPRMMFCKKFQGGWETDETIEKAAKSETLKEARVLGNVVGLVHHSCNLCLQGTRSRVDYLISASGHNRAFVPFWGNTGATVRKTKSMKCNQPQQALCSGNVIWLHC